MTERRNHCSSYRCEICGLPPLYYFHFGDGWEVAHWPGRAERMRLSIVEAMALPPLVGFRIYTCGSAVCVFRAKHHGVPGERYAATMEHL